MRRFHKNKYKIDLIYLQDYFPTNEQKIELFQNGMGEKKISLCKSDDPADFTKAVEKVYPMLAGDGFKIFRCAYGERTRMLFIKPPFGGYTSRFMSDESGLGQALMVIRPMSDIELVSTYISFYIGCFNIDISLDFNIGIGQ